MKANFIETYYASYKESLFFANSGILDNLMYEHFI